MIDALTAAAGSMANDIARLSTISQNLMNASTPAYKREMLVGQPFQRAMERAGLEDGVAAPSTAIDLRLGTLRFTGNPLDLALDGDGFFEVQTENGTAYTRQGDFRVDANGQLVTQAGQVVQGLGGALQLPNANPTVDRDGRVLDGDKLLGQLKVVRFTNPSQMTRIGGGLFQTAEAPTVPADGTVRLRQSHLEASNVNTASEMVKLVETMRHFEATQKVVQGVDEMMERALRKLGEF
ncbi:MAG TPA: flagellar hook-basal body protein [Burkholderiaceae bacterium]|nr:flagellar hook-basal body protein [Burkholderiaceae bacterium]